MTTHSFVLHAVFAFITLVSITFTLKCIFNKFYLVVKEIIKKDFE